MMAKIPGWAYIIVGAAITGYSWYVKTRKPSGALTFFFWIGILLLTVGVFKIVLGFIVPNHKEELEAAKTHDEYGDFLVCGKCKAKLHPQSKYCNWCGKKQ